jgi:hypothetical protein
LGPIVTLDGPWRLDIKDLVDPFSSDRLVCLYRIGIISKQDVESGFVEQVMKEVPADGNPSRRTGQSFSCRVWVGDVIAKLAERGVLELKKSIGEFIEFWNRDSFP